MVYHCEMKYLGIDFGLRKVGLATSEGNLASPWKVIGGEGFNSLVVKVKKEAENFDKVVVGMPEGKMGKIVKRLVEILRKNDMEVAVVDETLTSHAATSKMVELNIPKKKRRMNDAYSAAIILQNYLDKR